jgi:hypothetical protein
MLWIYVSANFQTADLYFSKCPGTHQAFPQIPRLQVYISANVQALNMDVRRFSCCGLMFLQIYISANGQALTRHFHTFPGCRFLFPQVSRHSTRMSADFHAVDLCFCKFIFLQMARHSPGISTHFQAADFYFHKCPGTQQGCAQIFMLWIYVSANFQTAD